MKNIKTTATLMIILIALLSAFFFINYSEFQHTFTKEEVAISSYKTAQEQLLTSIYNNLRREAQIKTDRIAEDLKEDLIEAYKDNEARFDYDYENVTPNSVLVKLIDDAIHNERDRFFHVVSDANDMFVLSKIGVVSDKSQDCAKFGMTRSFEDEISMHHNKHLAKEAIKALTEGKNEGVFWRFRGHELASQGLLQMNIDEALKLDLEDLKDYEFLVASYIDSDEDIFNRDIVHANGIVNEEANQLIVVQGFNLYEQIQANNSESFILVNKDLQIQLAVIENDRRHIIIRSLVSIILIFVCFFSAAALQTKGRD